jgi:6-phosphogluconolactonase
MKALFTVTSLFLIFLFSGCLGSSSSSTAPRLAFMYVVGEGDNAIRGLAESTVGDLSSLAVPSFPTNPRPVSIALHPSKNFLYVPNLTSNTVSGFNIDHVSGVLSPIGTAVPPTPACASPSVCSNPIGIGINSAGTFLFLLNQGSTAPAAPASISVFSIDPARGLLTPIAGSPFAFASLSASNPQFLAMSPNASFLYVSNGALSTISVFSIGANGALSEISGSPFSAGAGATVAGLAIDSKGQFLYAADSANNKIMSFSIAASGSLAPVAGSPFATGAAPVAIALDATGSFLYSANRDSGNVSAFKTNSGTLTEVSGSPYGLVPSGTPQPAFLTVDVSNTFLYVGNVGTTSISAFGIKAADGTLTPLKNSPFQQGIEPVWIVTTQ